MTSNPYITQHYGSSMEVLSNGADGDEMPDATVGFRRFPNATHMTHTVFRPKRGPPAPVTAAASPPLMAGRSLNVPETPDVLAMLRQRKGIPVDGFPSRPVTPRGSTSANSLPPLLPADRLSIASNESLRDRGAGLLREWVKAPSDDAVTTATPDSNGGSAAVTPDGAAPGLTTAPSTGEQPPPAPSSPLAAGDERHAAFPPALEAPPAVEHNTSISVSPESPRLGSSACVTGPSTPNPAPEPPAPVVTVSAALQKSRDALAKVERLLDDAPMPGISRALPPPPPLSSSMEPPPPPPRAPATLPAPTVAQTEGGDAGEVSPEDSMSYLSPLSSSHVPVHAFPPAERRVAVAVLAASSPTHSASRTAAPAASVTVPDETRFMVLCTVADPAEVVARRLRVRGPPAGGAGDDVTAASASGLYAAASPQPARRIAEVAATRRLRHSVHAPHEPTATQRPARSASASQSTLDGATLASASPSAGHLLHEDSALLHELAHFLRSANPGAFSSLKAATRATAAPDAPAPRTTSPQGPLRGRRRSSPAAAFPAPTVLAGRPPPASLLSHRHSSVTAPSHLDSVHTPTSPALHPHTDGSATQAEISPRRVSLRVRRVDSLPSYAQPTLSWLSKGTEAAADVFPVGLVPPSQPSPLKDESAVTLESQGSHSSVAAS